MTVIEATGLTKRFSLDRERPTLFRLLRRPPAAPADVWALRDVSFDVRRGETVGVIGGNGSGKSTLLRIVAGIYGRTSGTLRVTGRVVGSLQLGLGLKRDLTCLDNLYLFGALMALDRRRVRAMLDAIVAFAELEGYLDVPVRNLSWGMLQRLCFALLHEADLEIATVDEMLSGADDAFVEKCVRSLRARRGGGRTWLISTHDLDVISRLCDRVLLLEAGRPVAFGPTDEVVREYARRSDRS